MTKDFSDFLKQNKIESSCNIKTISLNIKFQL